MFSFSQSHPTWVIVHLRVKLCISTFAHLIASREAIADLISQNVLSLSQLVMEMGDILTSTDAVVRARGILLLGELWVQLFEKPLEDKVIHHFATFFSARLEDWHSLHGALLGTLALSKRGKDVGAISNEDAIAVLESALENLQVQALAQQNRMLCLELLECFLLCHSEAVTFHGAIFAERLCDIIDGEKDPRCLLIGFHVVELATQMFPDPTGPIGRVSEELFGIISCYFPVSFNPAPDDERGITREDISVVLMHCFGSTKLFADFCIPFLLEKLSSTLKSAKLDSLKFLGFCVSHYGGEQLQKHCAAIWMALKQELLSSQKRAEISSAKTDVEILKESLNCFGACLRSLQAGNADDIELPEIDPLLQLVLQDAFLDDFFDCLRGSLIHTGLNDVTSSCRSFVENPPTGTAVALERALATIEETGSILTVAIKASPVSCFAVLQALLERLVEVLRPGICIEEKDVLGFLDGVPLESTLWFPSSLMVAVLEVLSSVVEGAKEIAEGFYKSILKTKTSISGIKCIAPLRSYSQDILMVFVSMIVSGLQKRMLTEPSRIEKNWKTAVAGLQAVGSFPPQVSALSSNQYEFLVKILKSIILKWSEVMPLWGRTVETIAAICSMEERFSDQELRYGLIDTFVSLLFKELLDDRRSLPVQCSLRALSVLCKGRPSMLMPVLRKLTGVVCKDLKKIIPLINGGDDTSRRTVPLLQGVLDFILRCCENTYVESEAMLELATDMWNVVENLCDCACAENPAANMQVQDFTFNLDFVVVRLPHCENTYVESEAMLELATDMWNVVENLCDCACAENPAANMQILECCLEIVQFSVSRCNEPSQRQLMLKMLDPFLRASSHLVVHLEVQDVWIVGFFASTVIALLPSVQIPDEEKALSRLLAAAVSSACSPVNVVASEAVGCMLNKWHASSDKKLATSGIDASITEATDLLIKGEWISRALCHERSSNHLPIPEEALVLKRKCIKLLACAGKGLAMRGHIAVSDVAMLLLSLVQCKKSLTGTNPGNLLEVLWPNDQEKCIVSFAAAEALGFISKESNSSICKQNHFIIKPLYQQRFFVSMLPPLLLVLNETDVHERAMLYYAFGNLVAGIPITVVLTESNRAFPLVLESLSALSGDERHSDVLLSVLLVLSSILVDKLAAEVASQHVPAIIGRLQNLINYRDSAVVRETSLLCLGALVALPYARVFPFRAQVLKRLLGVDEPGTRLHGDGGVSCRKPSREAESFSVGKASIANAFKYM
ncbi:hypothetical protein GOP47_0004847 [Adiantum capillus-veneris]|uniref:MMS19 nucleotide excision repair protein n=1 Tax=Adiantum capillus-veneris TaxID=13818 RepID=A0A9D4V516_ADICA|nr:hypothetical protein GOP47_0004847 [Adiantum capillus-veneris]